ncbi:LOW QUALITY PROTEIN: hypothetical protein NC652_004822 [Populus alba x Populus x berolinensis]|nr:LOW QUALITY PROTEIN: hypothetical protein NC652_004822 [Populus alba x Populus x berolinensis]
MGLVVPVGAYAVRLGTEASIKQKVPNIGEFLLYPSIWLAPVPKRRNLTCLFSPNSEPRDWGILPMQTMFSSNGWDAYAWAFHADGPEVEISINNPGVGGGCRLRPTYNLLKNGNFEEGSVYVSQHRLGCPNPNPH